MSLYSLFIELIIEKKGKDTGHFYHDFLIHTYQHWMMFNMATINEAVQCSNIDPSSFYLTTKQTKQKKKQKIVTEQHSFELTEDQSLVSSVS
jgi:hypothetical protein